MRFLLSLWQCAAGEMHYGLDTLAVDCFDRESEGNDSIRDV
jgi:hypothetical protein